MPDPRWSKLAGPAWEGLPPEERRKVVDRLGAEDPDFQALPAPEQERVRTRVLGRAATLAAPPLVAAHTQPTATPAPTAPVQPGESEPAPFGRSPSQRTLPDGRVVDTAIRPPEPWYKDVPRALATGVVRGLGGVIKDAHGAAAAPWNALTMALPERVEIPDGVITPRVARTIEDTLGRALVGLRRNAATVAGGFGEGAAAIEKGMARAGASRYPGDTRAGQAVGSVAGVVEDIAGPLAASIAMPATRGPAVLRHAAQLSPFLARRLADDTNRAAAAEMSLGEAVREVALGQAHEAAMLVPMVGLGVAGSQLGRGAAPHVARQVATQVGEAATRALPSGTALDLALTAGKAAGGATAQLGRIGGDAIGAYASAKALGASDEEAKAEAGKMALFAGAMGMKDAVRQRIAARQAEQTPDLSRDLTRTEWLAKIQGSREHPDRVPERGTRAAVLAVEEALETAGGRPQGLRREQPRELLRRVRAIRDEAGGRPEFPADRAGEPDVSDTGEVMAAPGMAYVVRWGQGRGVASFRSYRRAEEFAQQHQRTGDLDAPVDYSERTGRYYWDEGMGPASREASTAPASSAAKVATSSAADTAQPAAAPGAGNTAARVPLTDVMRRRELAQGIEGLDPEVRDQWARGEITAEQAAVTAPENLRSRVEISLDHAARLAAGQRVKLAAWDPPAWMQGADSATAATGDAPAAKPSRTPVVQTSKSEVRAKIRAATTRAELEVVLADLEHAVLPGERRRAANAKYTKVLVAEWEQQWKAGKLAKARAAAEATARKAGWLRDTPSAPPPDPSAPTDARLTPALLPNDLVRLIGAATTPERVEELTAFATTVVPDARDVRSKKWTGRRGQNRYQTLGGTKVYAGYANVERAIKRAWGRIQRGVITPEGKVTARTREQMLDRWAELTDGRQAADIPAAEYRDIYWQMLSPAEQARKGRAAVDEEADGARSREIRERERDLDRQRREAEEYARIEAAEEQARTEERLEREGRAGIEAEAAEAPFQRRRTEAEARAERGWMRADETTRRMAPELEALRDEIAATWDHTPGRWEVVQPTPERPDAVAAARRLTELGQRVVFVRGRDGAFDGWNGAVKGGTVWINASADNMLLGVAGHEFVHTLPEPLRARFVAAVRAAGRVEDYAGGYRELVAGRKDVPEELAADWMGQLWGDRRFWEDVAARVDEGTFRGVVRRWVGVVNRWMGRVRAEARPVTGPEAYRVDRYIDDLGAAKNAALDTMADYVKARRRGELRFDGRETGIAAEVPMDLQRRRAPEGMDVLPFGPPERTRELRGGHLLRTRYEGELRPFAQRRFEDLAYLERRKEYRDLSPEQTIDTQGKDAVWVGTARLAAAATPVEIGHGSPTYVIDGGVWADMTPRNRVHRLLRLSALEVRDGTIYHKPTSIEQRTWIPGANAWTPGRYEWNTVEVQPEHVVGNVQTKMQARRRGSETEYLPGMEPPGEMRQRNLFGREDAQFTPIAADSVTTRRGGPFERQRGLFEAEERQVSRDDVDARRRAEEERTGQGSLFQTRRGAEVRIVDELRDVHRGEKFGTVRAIDPATGRVVGFLDYSVWGGEAAIQMIEVAPEYRRQGIATRMRQALKESYPDAEVVSFGDVATPDGQAFEASFSSKRKPDRVVTVDVPRDAAPRPRRDDPRDSGTARRPKRIRQAVDNDALPRWKPDEQRWARDEQNRERAEDQWREGEGFVPDAPAAEVPRGGRPAREVVPDDPFAPERFEQRHGLDDDGQPTPWPQRLVDAVKHGGKTVATTLLRTIPQGGRAPADVLRDQVGEKAEPLVQGIERAWWEGGRLGATLADPMLQAYRALTRAERAWVDKHFVWTYEDGGRMPSERVREFARAWEGANREVARRATDLAVETLGPDGDWTPFASRDPQRYIPHMMTREVRDALTQRKGPTYAKLVQVAAAQGIPVDVLRALADTSMVTKRHGSLEHPRLSRMPREIVVNGKTIKVLETDPEMLFRHVRTSGRRLAIVEEFGQHGTPKYLDAMTQYLVDNGLDANWAREAIPRIWERLQGEERTGNPFKHPALRNTLNVVEAATAATNLSAAVIPNLLGGALPEMVRFGVVPTAKQFVRAYTTAIHGSSHDATVARRLGNMSQDLMRGLQMTEHLEGLPGRMSKEVLRATGFHAANERINLAVALGMSRTNLTMMLDLIARNETGTLRKLWGKDAAWARRYLRNELGFADADIRRMTEDGITEADMSRAIQKQTELVNAINESPMARPPFVANPLFRMVFAYSTYVRKFARTVEHSVREARHGNVRPLVTLLAAGTVTGEAIIAARNFLKDREREDTTWWERLYRNMLEVGAFGMYQSVEYGLRHYGEFGHDFFGDVVIPPQLSTIDNVTTGLVRTIMESSREGEVDLRPLWRSFRRQTPAVDIVARQVERFDVDGIPERLATMVYTQADRKKDRRPLDAKGQRQETVDMLVERWLQSGRTRRQLIEEIRRKRRKD